MRAVTGLVLVAAILILWRHRRRSRRATTLAFTAVAAWGGFWLFGVLWLVMGWGNSLPPDSRHTLDMVLLTTNRLCDLASLLLLVWATGADRGPSGPSAPESDFADHTDRS
jgi:hypothetical protein